MSEGGDSDLEEEIEVEEMLEVGFGEVEFEEIKIGFEVECEEEHEDLTDEDLNEFLSLDFVVDALGTLSGHTLVRAEEPLQGENLQAGFEGLGNLDLEGALSDDVVQNDEGSFEDEDFYKVRGVVGEAYDVEVYEGDTRKAYDSPLRDDLAGPDGFVDIVDINISVESNNGRREERSMLEISGFRDEEAEKKREEKRQRFW